MPTQNEKQGKVNTIATGVLFFSFSIVVLVSQGIGQAQKNLAYAYLFLSVVLAIWAFFPRKL